MKTKIFYFGCWGELGHMIWNENHTLGRNSSCPFRPEELDGGAFLPGRGPVGNVAGRYQPQSLCNLTHECGWTLLACWDRTGDSRFNSNSTFLAEGDHDFAAMVAMARSHFPEVVERIEKAAKLELVP